jgi:FAD/FMN-containing dehydrogenase
MEGEGRVRTHLFPIEGEGILPLKREEWEGWGGEELPSSLLPYLLKPQLYKELLEILEYARKERIVLLPAGEGSAFFPYPFPSSTCALLNPGWVGILEGVDRRNQTVWVPAGMKVKDVEKEIVQQGFTLTLSFWDRGTFGGNWIVPRGSFSVFQFTNPMDRLMGVRGVLADGSLLKSRPAPRTSAGPHLARSMMGIGPVRGYITEVLVRVTPRGEIKNFYGEGESEKIFQEVQRLVQKGYHFAFAGVLLSSTHTVFFIRKNLYNTWEERVAKYLKTHLPVSEREILEEDPTPPKRYGMVFRPWTEFFNQIKKGSYPRFFSEPIPQGIWEWVPFSKWKKEVPSFSPFTDQWVPPFLEEG